MTPEPEKLVDRVSEIMKSNTDIVASRAEDPANWALGTKLACLQAAIEDLLDPSLAKLLAIRAKDIEDLGWTRESPAEIAATNRTFTSDTLYRLRPEDVEFYTDCADDGRTYQFARSAIYTTGTKVGDCWIVDDRGSIHPGYDKSPTPMDISNLIDVTFD